MFGEAYASITVPNLHNRLVTSRNRAAGVDVKSTWAVHTSLPSPLLPRSDNNTSACQDCAPCMPLRVRQTDMMECLPPPSGHPLPWSCFHLIFKAILLPASYSLDIDNLTTRCPLALLQICWPIAMKWEKRQPLTNKNGAGNMPKTHLRVHRTNCALPYVTSHLVLFLLVRGTLTLRA